MQNSLYLYVSSVRSAHALNSGGSIVSSVITNNVLWADELNIASGNREGVV